MRLANILAVTLAAAVAGYFSYFHSLRDAWRDLRTGKLAPTDGYSDMSRASRTVSQGAKTVGGLLSRLGAWATLLVTSVSRAAPSPRVVEAVALSSVAWIGGWVIGGIIGAMIGLAVDLILLGDQVGQNQQR